MISPGRIGRLSWLAQVARRSIPAPPMMALLPSPPSMFVWLLRPSMTYCRGSFPVISSFCLELVTFSMLRDTSVSTITV